ncbi:hypothetical protein QP185_07875 [Sphingomonas aerolata]
MNAVSSIGRLIASARTSTWPTGSSKTASTIRTSVIAIATSPKSCGTR